MRSAGTGPERVAAGRVIRSMDGQRDDCTAELASSRFTRTVPGALNRWRVVSETFREAARQTLINRIRNEQARFVSAWVACQDRVCSAFSLWSASSRTFSFESLSPRGCLQNATMRCGLLPHFHSIFAAVVILLCVSRAYENHAARGSVRVLGPVRWTEAPSTATYEQNVFGAAHQPGRFPIPIP